LLRFFAGQWSLGCGGNGLGCGLSFWLTLVLGLCCHLIYQDSRLWRLRASHTHFGERL
jgi:hypothetical protein